MEITEPITNSYLRGMKLGFNPNDGGRSKYFKGKNVGDCVTRAIAIVTGRDYKEVYDWVKSKIGKTPRNGVPKKEVKKLLKELGGKWYPFMGIGTGCKSHLRFGEVPVTGKCICQLSHHVTTVIDGVINDTYHPGEDRCVYGVWIFKNM
jgi:hypothetical protein